ncbi:putative endonuclease [Acetitomaculum ruminis DSM 5522]|uniref:Putative endonuclease n=1 Tax=Acetitomaculum ruminis DSM 5522 TaxID=1120918 RepID=A0A1I0ZE19_9FIRM|nr:GIY-YIG nuclease family protein [Acetitomaculum ruminis]SFB22790.1 putative endonuclease [Acetitomaculum ruminis DSM 5522]
MKNYTYILECFDGTYYTGWTNDLVKRVKTHNSGQGGKYTRSRLPVKLVYFECFETKKEAMSREYHIKKLSRKEKEKLIGKQNISPDLKV